MLQRNINCKIKFVYSSINLKLKVMLGSIVYLVVLVGFGYGVKLLCDKADSKKLSDEFKGQ